MSLIFAKPLSEVTNGSCKNLGVAAIIASGVLMAYCCRKRMAVFLISVESSIIIQSFKSSFSFLFSTDEILCQPNSSLSEITEIMTVPSKNGSVFSIPSCTLIKKLVSAIKLNPMISHFFLIGNAIQISFQFSKMFTKRFFLALVSNAYKNFGYFLFGNGLFNFIYHNNKFAKV